MMSTFRMFAGMAEVVKGAGLRSGPRWVRGSYPTPCTTFFKSIFTFGILDSSLIFDLIDGYELLANCRRDIQVHLW